MTILKHVLLGSFRIALLGMLKFTLFTYTFFLPNTGFATGEPKGDADAAAYGVTEIDNNGNARAG
jgi:hypothetical protein